MMMTTYKRLLLLAALPAFLQASCSREDLAGKPTGSRDAQNGEIRFEIGFAPMDGATQTDPPTRVATDTEFNNTWENGDEIGIFAVNHGEQLAASGNYIHNVKLTHTDGAWTASEEIYWPVGGKKLDFYAYYPYNETVSAPTAIAFSVHSDQSATTNIGGTEKSSYSLSGLLTAKAEKRGKGETVQLSFTHALAMVQVSVSKSMVGDYAPDALHVWLNGCTADCVLDLSAQTATQSSLSATPEQIKMYPCPDDGNAPGIYAYRALVPVQTIASGTVMFSFDYNGSALLRSRPLATGITLASGRAETFDMTFPFTSVTVSATQRLAALLTTAELEAITHLRVLGEMEERDFNIIRGQMHALTDLDLSGATVENDAIPYMAFRDNNDLKRFAFPRNFKKIDTYAFYGCSGLTGSLTIPEGVTTIDGFAFSGCSGFNGPLTIPESVKTIGNYAFHDCWGLTGPLTIPPGVTRIGNSAFKGCSSLTGPLTIPEGVTRIEDSAFSFCSSLAGSLKIPESVTTIEGSAFSRCSSLTGPLTIPPGVTTINSATFGGCSGFTGPLKIPEGVTTIGNGAFANCSGFNGNLTIPQSVTRIDDGAFNGCSSLTGSLKIPESVTWIGEGAFKNCSGLTGSLKISESVTWIGTDAFQGCSGLTGSLIIPSGVTTISDGTFRYCSNFTGNLTIPEHVERIGECAFADCSGLSGSLTIPQGVTTIAHQAFLRCSRLSSITCHLPEPGNAAYGREVFEGVPADIPVRVPKTAVNAYIKHSVWGRFTNIQAIP